MSLATSYRPLLHKRSLILSMAISIVLLSECASIALKETGFSDVQQQASQRVGSRVQWRQDPASNSEMDAAVEKLLQDDLTADEAVQIALLNNRSLQAMYENLGSAQANLVQAGFFDQSHLQCGSGFPGRRWQGGSGFRDYAKLP